MATSGDELIRAWFESSPFIRRLGLRLVALEAGRAVVALPFDAGNATAGDVVHGGAIGTLIDCAAASAAWAGHEPRGERWGTIAMSVNFASPARGCALTATASVTRRGRAICYLTIAVADADGAAVADGLVTYRLG